MLATSRSYSSVRMAYGSSRNESWMNDDEGSGKQI